MKSRSNVHQQENKRWYESLGTFSITAPEYLHYDIKGTTIQGSLNKEQEY